MKGDRVEVVIDAGDGVRTYEIAATRAGRRVEISTGRGIVEVTEVTRTGEAVRTGRFMASRVLALVEFPAAERQAPRRWKTQVPGQEPLPGVVTAAGEEPPEEDRRIIPPNFEW